MSQAQLSLSMKNVYLSSTACSLMLIDRHLRMTEVGLRPSFKQPKHASISSSVDFNWAAPYAADQSLLAALGAPE